MTKEFLQNLGLSDEQMSAILEKNAEKTLHDRLIAEGVHSVSAAKGVIAEENLDTSDLDSALTLLKEKHGYLFTANEPVFTGPAGGDKGTDEQALRRALGIM